MKDFDRMFNEYFGDEEDNRPKMPNMSDEAKRMFNLVDKLNVDSSLEENELGEPTSKRIVEIDGVKFEETVWETDEGSVVSMKALEPQIIDMKNLNELGGIMNSFFNKVETLKEKTPEQLLEEAIESENYEEAVKLRDIINNKKEKNKENKERAENLNNKGFPEDEDWNF